MIERKFVEQNFKEFQIKEFVKNSLNRVGLSDVKVKRTSLGERIIVFASRPGLVVGRGGSKIQRLTRELKERFNLENPQIEIEEVKEFNSNAAVVAEMIVNQLERFGARRFKGIGHKSVDAVMKAGALGVEILISGKIPSARSKTWRFVDGYMKKCGDLAISGVDSAVETANLKIGAVGVQVRIIPGDVKLPDQMDFSEETTESELDQAEESADSSTAEAVESADGANDSENTETVGGAGDDSSTANDTDNKNDEDNTGQEDAAADDAAENASDKTGSAEEKSTTSKKTSSKKSSSKRSTKRSTKKTSSKKSTKKTSSKKSSKKSLKKASSEDDVGKTSADGSTEDDDTTGEKK